jgi:hypothetical protein
LLKVFNYGTKFLIFPSVSEKDFSWKPERKRPQMEGYFMPMVVSWVEKPCALSNGYELFGGT